MPSLPDEALARRLDAADPLARFRTAFHLPVGPDGQPLAYLCSHSLGPQPRSARGEVEAVLAAWERLGVDGHFHGDDPWYTYPNTLHEPLARLVGALPDEVVLMNGLSVNLHFLLATFYSPHGQRRRILIEEPAFPSDLYAIKSHLRHRGHDPADALLTWRPRLGEHLLRTEDALELLDHHGHEIAVVLLNVVNFLTGQRPDLGPILPAARRHGCTVGLDLAHAVGNVPLRLHDDNVDFAVWCSYKYLCGGPGALAGAFVHQRHATDLGLPRLAGWWGNDPATRFRMQLEPEFTPQPGAGGWQVSNPPILALAPLRAALALYDQAGMAIVRAKSEALTAFLLDLVGRMEHVEVLTPATAEGRGCQVSLRLPGRGREALVALREAGIVADFREPDVLRVAPLPLANTFQEVWHLGMRLAEMA